MVLADFPSQSVCKMSVLGGIGDRPWNTARYTAPSTVALSGGAARTRVTPLSYDSRHGRLACSLTSGLPAYDASRSFLAFLATFLSPWV